MPQLFTDPDLLDSVIVERHHSAPAAAPTNAAARKDRQLARKQVWSAIDNVRGVLGTGKALTPEDICRHTGLMPEQCGAALCELETQGVVVKDGAAWRMVFA